MFLILNRSNSYKLPHILSYVGKNKQNLAHTWLVQVFITKCGTIQRLICLSRVVKLLHMQQILSLIFKRHFFLLVTTAHNMRSKVTWGFFPRTPSISHRVSSSSVVEHPTRSWRVVGSNPIWDWDFFWVYVSPRIYLISCCCYPFNCDGYFCQPH